jgi:sortase A
MNRICGPAARVCAALAIVCFAAAGAVFGRDAWLWGKGLLAERLIDDAWARTRHDGVLHAPWSWADFRPVARLEAPRLGLSRAVLSQSAGSALAFGLGHVAGSALPGSSGSVVLAGHRDSWGAFLKRLRRGDRLVLETARTARAYRVTALEVVDEKDLAILDSGSRDSLTILTCYPFEALGRGPWRFAVRASPLPEARNAVRSRMPGP